MELTDTLMQTPLWSDADIAGWFRNQVVAMQPGDLLQIGPRTLQLQLHHVAS